MREQTRPIGIGWGEKTGHTCPHNGWKNMNQPNGDPGICGCGQSGYLCPACREDREDRRTREPAEGLALAALMIGRGVDDPAATACRARNHAAALRDREGGEA